MPVMFINEYVVCIKSGQHITEARNGQFIQMTNGNYRGEGVLLFWPSLGGPVGGVNVNPCIFAGTATQAMRQRRKKWTGPACNNLQVLEKKKVEAKESIRRTCLMRTEPM